MSIGNVFITAGSIFAGSSIAFTSLFYLGNAIDAYLAIRFESHSLMTAVIVLVLVGLLVISSGVLLNIFKVGDVK